MLMSLVGLRPAVFLRSESHGTHERCPEKLKTTDPTSRHINKPVTV
jgi:hypothetical protein